MSKHNVMPTEAMDLVSASSIGAYSTVDDILRNNLEYVNTVNSSGWTPVMYAANYGHFNIIRLLIRYGCDVDHKDWQGRTALMLAASNGHTRCLDVLINYGKADKTLKDLSGTDAYKYAKNCGHGNNKLIKTLLKSEGYELRGRPFNAPTPAPSPVFKPRRSLPITQNTVPEDEIYNPYETTAFSNSMNSFWRTDGTNGTNGTYGTLDFLLREREALNQKVTQLEEKLNEMNAKN